jgi:hypothetical protein
MALELLFANSWERDYIVKWCGNNSDDEVLAGFIYYYKSNRLYVQPKAATYFC